MTTTSDFRPPIMLQIEAPPPYPSQEDFAALVGRAEEGEDDALEHLQRLLDNYDDLGQSLDTISRMIERHLVDVAAGDSRPRHGQIERFIAKVRRGFMNGDGDAMEVFLIHRIIVSHVNVNFLLHLANTA